MRDSLERLRKETFLQGQVIELFLASVSAPIFYHSGKRHRGYRFANPGARHFCLLKAVRAVSGLNAALSLAEKGFNQEICVLIRTIVECTSHIEFILAGFEEGELGAKQREFLDAYFSDFRRNEVADFRRAKLVQKNVHDVVGNKMDKNFHEIEHVENPTVSGASQKMSNIYLAYSNYVHGRYPEIMDMYGGSPGHFHLTGMLGTRKDAESFQFIECFVESVSLVLRAMIYEFEMVDELRNSPQLVEWLKV